MVPSRLLEEIVKNRAQPENGIQIPSYAVLRAELIRLVSRERIPIAIPNLSLARSQWRERSLSTVRFRVRAAVHPLWSFDRSELVCCSPIHPTMNTATQPLPFGGVPGTGNRAQP